MMSQIDTVGNKARLHHAGPCAYHIRVKTSAHGKVICAGCASRYSHENMDRVTCGIRGYLGVVNVQYDVARAIQSSLNFLRKEGSNQETAGRFSRPAPSLSTAESAGAGADIIDAVAGGRLCPDVGGGRASYIIP